MLSKLGLLLSVPLSLIITLTLASCASDKKNRATSSSPVEEQPQTAVLRIAAAANLASVLPSIIEDYNATNNRPIQVTYASSGKLYAQIQSGAPYDVFLSANQQFPEKLAQSKSLKTTTAIHKPFTYTRGQLVIHSTTTPLETTEPLTQKQLRHLFNDAKDASTYHKVVIANPQLAPYGRSAASYLKKNGFYNTLSSNKQLIQAENISQAFQYVHNGSVDFGFVAQSQLIATQTSSKQYITLPAQAYPAILQDGVIISSHPDATRFSEYLLSKPAQAQFIKAGYLAVIGRGSQPSKQ